MHARDDRARIDRLLGGADAAWLVQRVRARIAQGHHGPLTGSAQLRNPTAGERTAVRRLVGPPARAGGTLRVDLGELDALLRRGAWPAGLADAVVALTGPVPNRPRERATADAAWTRAADAFAPAVAAHPTLAAWWERWCAAGQLKRAARADPEAARVLAAEAAACLCALPSAGEPLAVFARRLTGDAHGLDRVRPLGRLVLAAAGALGGPDAGIAPASLAANVEVPGGAPLAPDDAVGPREVWASVGLLLSAVSSTVLCLGVPGAGLAEPRLNAPAEATAWALRAWRDAGVPVVLTLDQVRSGGVGAVAAGEVVHVCENPSVVEVVASEAALSGRAKPADRAPQERIEPADPASATSTPVLVCTYGQPGAAVLELLDRLTASGAPVRYHGDFDWAGLRIASTLAAHTPWLPWRFGAADYLAAVGAASTSAESADGAVDRQPLALRGPQAPSPWDPELAQAMAARGVAIEEEEVVALLVADLLSSGPDLSAGRAHPGQNSA